MFREDLLKDRVVVVTGGATGLGRSMTERMAELGAIVVIGSRTEETVRGTAADLSGKGLRVEGDVVNVREPESVRAFAKAVLARHGHVDALVNNAAGNFLATSEDLSPRAFHAVVDTVLYGTFHCTQAFGNAMIEARRGHILNICTTYAWTGSAFVLPSACAKAGVLAMTRSLAVEWATYGVRINAIAPGPFPTEGAWSRLFPPGFDHLRPEKKVPLGRCGEHHELANLAVYMIAEEQGYMTGEVVTLDGGDWMTGGQFNALTHLDREKLKDVIRGMRRAR